MKMNDDSVVGGPLPVVARALLVLYFVMLVLVSVIPLKYFEGRTIPDDCFYSLSISRNMARGEGPWYETGYTNGYQPLYVLLMVPAYKLIGNHPVFSVHVALVMLSAFNVMALYVLLRIVILLTRSRLSVYFALIMWMSNLYVLHMSLNGLETIISIFFMLTVIYFFLARYWLNNFNMPLRISILVGVLLGFSMLARVDNVFLVISIAGTFVAVNFARHWSWRRVLLSCLAMGLGYSLIMIPWLYYSYLYTGVIYPTSGRAVRVLALEQIRNNPIMIRPAVATVISNNWVELACIFSGIILLVLTRVRPKSVLTGFAPLAPMGVYCIMLLCAYGLYILTYWFFPRYLFPFAPLFLLCAVKIVDLYLSITGGGRWNRIVVLVMLSIAAILHLCDPNYWMLFDPLDHRQWNYATLADWVKEKLPRNTIIGCRQTGALAYFADEYTIINLDGVMNKAAYESLVQKRQMQYINEQAIDYVIAWDLDAEGICKSSKGEDVKKLVLVEKIDGFKSRKRGWSLYQVK